MQTIRSAAMLNRQTHVRWRSASQLTKLVLLLALGGVACTRDVPSPRAEAVQYKPIPVCDVLKDVSRYRGKIIAVKGIYWYGMRQNCAEPVVLGTRVWPSVLD